MKRILRTLLSHEKAREYCIETLTCGHMLSRQLVKILSFNEGDFFAITAETANISKIHDFRIGWLLPPNPLEKLTVLGVEYAARRQSNSREEFVEYLEKILRNNKNVWCVFEDVTFERGDPQVTTEANIAYFKNEVYYYLRGDRLTFEKGMQLIRDVDAMWYYMSLVTEEPIQVKNQELTEEKLEKIAARTTHLAVGAYDMEGYVCWERKSQKGTR